MITHRRIEDNGDATTTYDIEINTAISFEDLFNHVMSNEKFFSIDFYIENKEFETYCFGNKVVVGKDRKSNERYFCDRDSKHLYNNIKKFLIKKCWANGGYGQIKYFVTFFRKGEENEVIN